MTQFTMILDGHPYTMRIYYWDFFDEQGRRVPDTPEDVVIEAGNLSMCCKFQENRNNG